MNENMIKIMSLSVIIESLITYFKEFFVYECLSISMVFSIILGIVIGISGTIFNKGLLVSQILYKKTNLSIEMKCIIPFIVLE